MDEQKEEKQEGVAGGNIQPEVDVTALLAQIEELKRKDQERDEQFAMLKSVADQGRIFNYESSKAQKQPAKVKIGVYNEKLLVGWRVAKDIRINHPTTGRQVGEEQEIEVLLLDKEGNTTKEMIKGYPAFSDARYNERIEAEVVGKKEDWDGKLTLICSCLMVENSPWTQDS